MITTGSPNKDLYDSLTYVAVITKQGTFEIGTPDEGNGQVRVVNLTDDPQGENAVKNALAGKKMQLEVTPYLGYTIEKITLVQTDENVSTHTLMPGGSWTYDSGKTGSNAPNGTFPVDPVTGTPVNTEKGITYTFTMPERHLDFTVSYKGRTAVSGVAYVSGQGRKSGGYNNIKSGTEQVGTADSWGTASNDLQAVINSWKGPRDPGNENGFDEIWIEGTVTPKRRANTKDGYSISVSDIPVISTDPNDPNQDRPVNPADPDLAFVIPPGLKIYGGFTGTERYVPNGTAIGDFPGPISANPGNNDKRDKPTPDDNQDWRLRSVLSGALTGMTNAYHVVIMADIPFSEGAIPDKIDNPATFDDNVYPTVLDGLTISGGKGSANPGRIDFGTYTGNDGIGRQSGAGLYLVNASPVLNNVRVQGNTATATGLGLQALGGGGGIYNLATGSGKVSSPRLFKTVVANNTILGNTTAGGMYNEARGSGSICRPVLDNVKIEQNQTSGNAGGIFIDATVSNAVCEPLVINSEIIGNAAGYGGGVYINGYAAPRFDNVVIRENNVASGGGLISQPNTQPVFTNVTIAGNIAGSGGGIYGWSQYLTMTNSTISGNIASDSGGGIFMTRGGAVLTNVRLEYNSASVRGGAIYTVTDKSNSGNRNTLVITNGIIRSNKANNGGGIYNNYGFTGSGYAGLVTRIALTNVLIADNTANSNGGGIFNNNELAANTTTPGDGISILMNNVTIAGNAANASSAGTSPDYNGGGGIYSVAANNSNKIKIEAINSIIWGNTAASANSPRANIFNDDATRLILNNSLVASGGYLCTNNNPVSSTNPFTGGTDPETKYTLGSGLAGTYGLYPASNGEDTFLGGGDGTGALSGSRYTIFKALITAAVYTVPADPNLFPKAKAITKDVTAALGDRNRTTIVDTVGDLYSVRFGPPPSGQDKDRETDAAFDIGAYAK
jgi:predicted outer membrane repeat protein